jgi:hypothetical protein
LKSLRVTTPEGVSVMVTAGAGRGFRELVRPTMDEAQAHRELARLVGAYGKRCGRPGWVDSDNEEFYVEISDGVVLGCKPRGQELVGLAVLCRSYVPEAHRTRLNEKRSARRKRVAARRRPLGKQGRPEPEAW